MDRNNPEALHDVGQGKAKVTADSFVNPGTPAAPLVTREQMTQATVKGAGTDALRKGIIK